MKDRSVKTDNAMPTDRQKAEPPEAEQCLAPMDFSTFVLSLASSAAVQLGQVSGPEHQAQVVDIPAAKQIVDILAVLEEKTRGNLEPSEEQLLKSVLYDLRIQCVDAQKSSESSS